MYSSTGNEDQAGGAGRIDELVRQLKFRRSYEGTSHVPGILVGLQQRNKALRAIGEAPLSQQIEKEELEFSTGLGKLEGGQEKLQGSLREEVNAGPRMVKAAEPDNNKQLAIKKPASQASDKRG